MDYATQVVLVAGNAVALLAAFVGFVVWFRKWLVKIVQDPIQHLATAVDEQDKAIAANSKEITRAHARIDDVLLVGRKYDA